MEDVRVGGEVDIGNKSVSKPKAVSGHVPEGRTKR
jgi:hypothetical protein